MRTLCLWIAVLGGLPAACGDATPPAGDPLRVLFIGNSLTSYNNLPGMVEALSAFGPRPIEAGASLLDGSSLEDHWVGGTGRAALADGPWAIVVLQQGPSSLTSSAVNLLEWTGVWSEAIRNAGAEPALYAVWPEEERKQVFPDVSRHYRAAADAVGGTFLPAGDAWLAAWREDADLPLYGTDGFHPSQLGTLLAAMTIYGGLTGTVPDLPRELRGAFLTMEIPVAAAALLERAAQAALDAR